MKLKLDPWQQEVLDTEGNIALRSGRQVGKSTIISIKAAEYAVKHRKKTILIISAVERQAQLLFEKTLGYLVDNYKLKIKTGKERPTKHIVNLTNGSRIYCLPTGMSGYGIRGYTIDLLIADEAAFIPEDVWTAVTPMLAITKGTIILLSTPFGRGGYFYDCFNDPSYTTFHVSSEDCPRKDTDFLAREKRRMTSLQYAQEYLGEFVDELQRFFPTELIEKCQTIDPRTSKTPSVSPFSNINLFLGVDVARKGGDETVLASLARIDRKRLKMFELEVFSNELLTYTAQQIKMADKKHRYTKIYIDDGGLGVGVFDMLLTDEQTRRRVVAINNASRSLDRDDTKRKKLLKEDLYTNLLKLMQQGKIELFNSNEVMLSLKSVQYEYKDGKMKIFGKYTHITEALIRAAWCMTDKKLDIWVR